MGNFCGRVNSLAALVSILMLIYRKTISRALLRVWLWMTSLLSRLTYQAMDRKTGEVLYVAANVVISEVCVWFQII
jgi:hypothetical protein